MYLGFPKSFLRFILCPSDKGNLLLINSDQDDKERVKSGTLQCKTCNKRFKISEGIVNFLDANNLDVESQLEKELRDEHSTIEQDIVEDESDRMEIDPTFEAIYPIQHKNILELGCGKGRYTLHFLSLPRMLIAVDFSHNSLKVLSSKLPEDCPVGLILADVTKLNFERCFDRVLSTLVSNLPTAQHRDSMYKLSSQWLKQDGSLCFSTHYYGFRNMIERSPKCGRYREVGIFYQSFRSSDLKKEIEHYYKKIVFRKMSIVLPFTCRARLPLYSISRYSEKVPVINEFAKLLLVKATSPV